MGNGNNVALAKTEPRYQGLQMAVAPAEAKRRVQELQAFVKSVMLENEDYGKIPGTPKPSLWQPGAQKLAELYGLGWRFEDVTVVEDWERGFFFYRKKCVVFSRRDGCDIGDGVGSCNSREDKYAWRWVSEKNIPAGIDKATLKTRDGKYGRSFRIPSDDPYSVVNTIEKMAAKRAFVAAIIAATRSAGLFTQDLEDLPKEAFGDAEPSRSWQGDTGDAEVVTYQDPSPVLEAIGGATDKKSLNRIAAENRKKTWTDDDREKIKLAIEARVAALAVETPKAEVPTREPGEDDK